MCQAHVRRRAHETDVRAWLVAHLGHHGRGTTVQSVMRKLLGREPGTVPGQPRPVREMTADQGIQALLAMGAKDRRPEASRG